MYKDCYDKGFHNLELQGPDKYYRRKSTQKVIVDGADSEDAPVTSGVPQGLVLRLILFLPFINYRIESVI